MQKLKYYLTFTILIISFICNAQDQSQTIDSLFLQLEKADDQTKIDILNNISQSYWNISLDSSLYFANEALNLAHIHEDKKGISDSYNRIGNVYSFKGDTKLALEYYNKCLKIRLDINDSQGITNIYHNLAYEFVAQNNIDTAISYFQKALDQSIKRKDREDIIFYNVNIATLNQGKSNYKEALEYFLQALEVANNSNSEVYKADIYSGMGSVYLEISSYDEALKYFLNALNIYQENNNSAGISNSYNNLGILYQSLDDSDKALDYYQKTLEMEMEAENKSGIANAYNNLGTIYDEKGNKQKALEFYNKSLEIDREIDYKDGIATSLNNIGLIYLDLGNYNKAYTNLKKSADMAREMNNIYDLANNHNNLGKLFLKQKKYIQAQNNLNKAIELSKQINVKEWLIESYDLYYQLYSELNNYKKALEYFKLYSEINDSIYTNESTNRISEMKVKYETANLETENQLLKKDNQIQLLELNRQKNIKNYWIGFSILILALAVLSFSQFRLKKKTNKLLKSKNQQLEEANTRLKTSEKNLKELNDTKDKFFSIIAHDLKNPFQSLLGFSETLYNERDQLDEEQIKEYSRLVFESSQNLFNLLGNLLQWAKSQLGSIKLSPVKMNLNDSVEDVISLFSILIEKKNIRIKNQIDPDLHVLADKHVISTVLRNIISNAIKFTNMGGWIILSASIENKKVRISVQDNGKGIKDEDIEKLFRIDQSYSTKGTENESGTGLGLILCKELINQSGGDIIVESTLGKGSKFEFTLNKTD